VYVCNVNFTVSQLKPTVAPTLTKLTQLEVQVTWSRIKQPDSHVYYVYVFAFISFTIIVSANGMDIFPLTDISVAAIVNRTNTAFPALK